MKPFDGVQIPSAIFEGTPEAADYDNQVSGAHNGQDSGIYTPYMPQEDSAGIDDTVALDQTSESAAAHVQVAQLWQHARSGTDVATTGIDNFGMTESPSRQHLPGLTQFSRLKRSDAFAL